MKKERRDFLKITTAGAAGLALIRSTPARAAWPSSGKMEINPDISNMRVVACVDTAMMKGQPKSMDFGPQNDAVNTAQLQADMDAMAMALAQKGTADEAWKTIFRIDSSKDWPSAVIAVKVNGGFAKNTAHLAILQKLSNLFIGWGVTPQNFIVYDGHTMGTTGIFKSYFSTTDKSKVLGVVGGTTGSSEDLLGGWADAKLVDGTTRRCAANIANGKVDILINIANNKGHAYGTVLGNVTLCMKNHYGTWEPDSTHTDLANLIFKMNKSDPIIGGTPPRQQLCIVDSLFCCNADIATGPDSMPCYLVMGTFAPAVDYQTVKKIREAVSNIKTDDTKIEPYLTSFGYTTSDPQWILVPPAGAATSDAGPPGSGGSGAGGSSGSGDARTGGTGGSAGANAGGAKGSGGASEGGNGSGGVKTGGTSGSSASGGVKGSGGASPGGTSGSSPGASGGASGSSGAGSGGTTGNGGTRGGSGGTQASTVAGAGGVAASGGGSGTAGATPSSGCGCDVGGHGINAGGLGATLVAGTFIAGQLRRLFLRRNEVAGPSQVTKPSQPQFQDSASPHGDQKPTKE